MNKMTVPNVTGEEIDPATDQLFDSDRSDKEVQPADDNVGAPVRPFAYRTPMGTPDQDNLHPMRRRIDLLPEER